MRVIVRVLIRVHVFLPFPNFLSSDCLFIEVPIRNWMLIFVKKDQSKAMDFFTMLKKVSPPMGIEVSTYMYNVYTLLYIDGHTDKSKL